MATPLSTSVLTSTELDGAGVFDVLMRSVKAHLEAEFNKGRIRGPEYATVYLGALESTLQTALGFINQSRKVDLESQLLEKQIENATKEGEVLFAQKCKLEAEYDVTILTKDKVASETALLNQKKVTETAQTQSAGVDATSITGRQAALYQAQANGFQRDAEQKAAKLLIDTWNVRRTTDEGVSANTTNKLDDDTIGRVVNKVLAGVQA